MVLSPPLTFTRLSHALLIRVRGRVIGAIHTWSPQQSRTVDTEFEIDVNSTGRPAAVIPQEMGTRSLRIGRYDLYAKTIEDVFTDTEFENITDQRVPLTLREHWYAPGSGLAGIQNTLGLNFSLFGVNAGGAVGSQGSIGQVDGQVNVGQAILNAVSALGAGSQPRAYEYRGCFFQDIGRQISAQSDRTVNVDATITYRERVRIF